jgi:hypothetical protein
MRPAQKRTGKSARGAHVRRRYVPVAVLLASPGRFDRVHAARAGRTTPAVRLLPLRCPVPTTRTPCSPGRPRVSAYANLLDTYGIQQLGVSLPVGSELRGNLAIGAPDSDCLVVEKHILEPSSIRPEARRQQRI